MYAMLPPWFLSWKWPALNLCPSTNVILGGWCTVLIVVCWRVGGCWIGNSRHHVGASFFPPYPSSAESSTSLVQGRYAANVLSFANDPGLKQVIPVYLKAFCSLLSPNTIWRSFEKENEHHSTLCCKLLLSISKSVLMNCPWSRL
jgi:hypothetical protein